MRPIPDIVKEFVLEQCGRMPETDKEIDDYLDLINLSKEYVKALEMEQLISKRMMRKLGFKTTDEIKKTNPFANPINYK